MSARPAGYGTHVPILACTITSLDIEPEWMIHDGDGIGFVAGELGVWLEVRDTPAWTSVHGDDYPDEEDDRYFGYLDNLAPLRLHINRKLHRSQ
jgi:hypothetical protein